MDRTLTINRKKIVLIDVMCSTDTASERSFVLNVDILDDQLVDIAFTRPLSAGFIYE